MGKFIEHVSRIPIPVRYSCSLMFLHSTTERSHSTRFLEEVSGAISRPSP
jgi:hypothetical protein